MLLKSGAVFSIRTYIVLSPTIFATVERRVTYQYPIGSERHDDVSIGDSRFCASSSPRVPFRRVTFNGHEAVIL